jgi:hypothetical protein
MDIINRPVFYLKHKVSKMDSVSGSEIESSFFNWAHLSRFHLKTETESNLRNVGFLYKR